VYPWRSDDPDPYPVLVSEFMLQQTQVARVVPAYTDFLRRFPTIQDLARSSRADVVIAWSGLGYHRRAVALHDAARRIVLELRGRVPSDVETLLSLPGVGPYTAAAVASIAFGVPVAAVDTNVRRVTARVRAGVEPAELAPAEIEELAAEWLDVVNPGGWNAALMDLGRSVCRRRSPRCGECPIRDACRFRAAGRDALASPAPDRRQSRFEGSFRQIRGAVVAELRERSSATSQELARATGRPRERVEAAVNALVRDGLVEVERGRVRLPG
jgi:A/G-specific adenine glycosylase